MAKFRRGADAIKASANRGSANFAPMMIWKNGDEKYIQLLTAFEDIPTVLYHQFIRVDETDDGRPIYRSFISRRDPGLDGSEGYDPIWDRGYPPKNRQIAVAVELEPTHRMQGNRKRLEGFTVAKREFTTKSGETKTVPAVGLIIQSHLFFGALTTIDEVTPVNESVLLVKRRGGDQNTAYDIVPVADAIELDIEDAIDLDAYLDELADENRVRELIEPLPEDWVLDRFAERNRQQTEKKSVRKAEPEDEPQETPVVEESRWAKLRQDVQSQQSS